jgi:ABC-type lipoprotein release transport system permease subunit
VGRLFIGSDPSLLTTVSAATILLLAALVATVVPALRAARTDPTDALRRE